MKQSKWRLLSMIMVFMLCIQLLDHNMFMHVRAIDEPAVNGNTNNIAELKVDSKGKNIFR